MQFELSLFALGLLIPYVVWRRRLKLNWKHLSELSAALIIGFWPQVIHDLTQPLSQNQLGGFIAWVGYRLLSGLGFFENTHQLGLNKLSQTAAHFSKYGGRIFSSGHWLSLILAVAIILLALFKLFKQQKKPPVLIELTSLAAILLTLSYFIHSAPSEAYFSPYLILLPLLVGYGLVTLFKDHLNWLLITLVVYALINSGSILRLNFFVSQTEPFSYGPGVEEQRQIISLVNHISQGHYQWRTTDDYGRFPSYFAGYRWLAQELGLPLPDEAGQIFYLEKPASSLSGYPNLIKVIFPSRELYY